MEALLSLFIVKKREQEMLMLATLRYWSYSVLCLSCVEEQQKHETWSRKQCGATMQQRPKVSDCREGWPIHLNRPRASPSR